MFSSHPARRVTILVDASLTNVILDKVEELGAKGYNYVPCQGKGQHAVTGDPWQGDGVVRIEIVTTNEIAAAILDFVHAAQFAQFGQYALSAFADTVEVDDRDQAFS